LTSVSEHVTLRIAPSFSFTKTLTGDVAISLLEAITINLPRHCESPSPTIFV